MRFFKKKIERHSSHAEDAKRVISNDTPFAVTEAFRTLHTNLLYVPTKSKCKKFALTSAFSGEGKTYISINLAYTIAINSPDLKVLLIDCDMRKPRVAEIMGYKSSSRIHGLSEYLADIDELPNICNTKYDNLFLLPSGAESTNAMGLLTSKKMRKLIELCEKKFDFLIFDTPPVNIVSDTILLNDYIDGYIIVTRSEYSDINSISDAVDRLNSVDANIVGFVLCAYNSKNISGYTRHSKYGKCGKYGKYSSYSSHEGDTSIASAKEEPVTVPVAEVEPEAVPVAEVEPEALPEAKEELIEPPAPKTRTRKRAEPKPEAPVAEPARENAVGTDKTNSKDRFLSEFFSSK